MKLVIILAACLAVVCGGLPPNIFNPKCPKIGPETVKCLRRGIENFRQYLPKGIPDINVPRLEPFKMKKLELDVNVRNIMIVKGEATNIVVHGASNFQVNNLKFKVKMDKSYIMEITIYIPKLSVTADYDSTDSKFIGLKTSGSGQFQGIFEDITATVKTSGHFVVKNGLEYIELRECTADIQFGNSNIHVEPDQQNMITNAVAAFINRSGPTIIETLTPYINNAAGPIIQSYLKKTLDVIPLNDIFT